MNWKDSCLAALTESKLFITTQHRTRFKELIDCYCDKPFFTNGLCKCMYLSAWDDEHFFIMLEMLSAMSLGKEQNTEEMRIVGDTLAEEQTNDETYVYQLSNAFLDNTHYELPKDAAITPETLYIIQCALAAAEVIDRIS